MADRYGYRGGLETGAVDRTTSGVRPMCITSVHYIVAAAAQFAPVADYSESWNSITAVTESTASLSAASRSAADGAASTE